MRLYEITDNCYKIFVNNLLFEKFDFTVEKNLERFLKNIIMVLKNTYKINLNGLYIVEFFVNEKVGAFIYINKTDTIFPYKDIDLKIKIIFNCKFYFKTNKYEVLKNIKNVYFYQNNYYIDTCNLDEITRYVEFGDIIYDDALEIENLGIKIS